MAAATNSVVEDERSGIRLSQSFGTGSRNREPDPGAGSGRRNRTPDPEAGTGRRNRTPVPEAGTENRVKR